MQSNINTNNVDSSIQTVLFNHKQENPVGLLYLTKMGDSSFNCFIRVTTEAPTNKYLIHSPIVNPIMNTSNSHTHLSRVTGSDKVYICGIPVEISRDEGTVIVTDSIINMYGIGHNVEEAREDYKITVKAYYEELKESENKLGNNLKQHLNYLNTRDI